MTAPLLSVEAVSRRYPFPRERLFAAPRVLTALDGVSLALMPGEAVGIVGASGSGKSTLARLVMGFERPDAGRVLFRGRDLAALPETLRRAERRHLQMVFQDPLSSLDPRKSAGWSVAEPLLATGMARAARERAAAAALEAVGLAAGDAGRLPHAFSGGQRQRIAIARAIVTQPALIVADEPVSALDVSVAAQILNLLADIRAATGAALLVISHDLAAISQVTDRVIVLDAGRVVEEGEVTGLLAAPRHPVTAALVAAAAR